MDLTKKVIYSSTKTLNNKKTTRRADYTNNENETVWKECKW